MRDGTTDLLRQVADYYAAKLAEHGETPRGVDWNGADSQQLRFGQLCKLIDGDGSFSINDLGCGYGALYDYLAALHSSFSYAGIDVSAEMIDAAAQRLPRNVELLCADRPARIADYSVASGIFNVRMDRSDDEWWTYCQATLDILDSHSRFGFAFNCLTSYSDADKMHDYLYYADPLAVFDLCKRRYSRNVALLHDYQLYEFTILVRKQL